MEIEYVLDVCPISEEGTDGLCYDYGRLGTIACGICGANKKLAEDGRTKVLKEMKNSIKEYKERMNDYDRIQRHL